MMVLQVKGIAAGIKALREGSAYRTYVDLRNPYYGQYAALNAEEDKPTIEKLGKAINETAGLTDESAAVILRLQVGLNSESFGSYVEEEQKRKKQVGTQNRQLGEAVLAEEQHALEDYNKFQERIKVGDPSRIEYCCPFERLSPV